MKLTKVRDGYYEYKNFFIYKPDEQERVWLVYEWMNGKKYGESYYVGHAATLKATKEFLIKVIAYKEEHNV